MCQDQEHCAAWVHTEFGWVFCDDITISTPVMRRRCGVKWPSLVFLQPCVEQESKQFPVDGVPFFCRKLTEWHFPRCPMCFVTDVVCLCVTRTVKTEEAAMSMVLLVRFRRGSVNWGGWKTERAADPLGDGKPAESMMGSWVGAGSSKIAVDNNKVAYPSWARPSNDEARCVRGTLLHSPYCQCQSCHVICGGVCLANWR